MIDERIAERRAEVRDQRRRRRLRRSLALVIIAAVGAGLIAVEQSPLVGLEEVQVVGVERLGADDVREAADLTLGTSTLRLGLAAATERVEALPLVRTADISRVDPLTVEIRVEEREPVILASGGGESVMIDRDGVVLLEGEIEGLPEILLTEAPPEPGASVTEHQALANAHAVWQGLSGPFRTQVAEYEAISRDELTLRLDSGIQVRFGRAERLQEKIRALGAVLADVGATPIEVVDVRAPRRPVVVGVP